MPLDLNSNKEPIDQNDQQYQDVLQDLQGNILKSHGRDNSVHIFLTFPNPKDNLDKIRFPNPKDNLDKIRSLKQWIAQLANKDIISTKKQLDDAVAWRNEKRDAGVFVHFSLSSSGYAKLGLPDSQQPKSPNLQNRRTPDAKALNDDYSDVFQDGMKTRQYALLDPPVSAWERGFQNDIDALVIIAANNLTDVNQKQSEITNQLQNIATIATIEPGLVIRRRFNNTGKDNVVEPFGFTDGVGDPLFFQKDVVEEEGNIAKNIFSARLNLALVQDPFGTQNVSILPWFKIPLALKMLALVVFLSFANLSKMFKHLKRLKLH